MIIILVAVLVVVGGLGAWTVKNDGYLFGVRTPLAAPDYEGAGGADIQVEIPEGNGYAIGAELAEQDVVASADAFVRAFSANPDAGSIQPGTRVLKEQMSAAAAVELLVANDVVRGGLTIVEGHTVAQIEKTMIEAGWPAKDVKAAIADPKALGLPAEAGGELEGWLAASTYDAKPDSMSAVDVLKEAVATTVSGLNQLKVPADQRNEVIIKASLVEREARLAEDRPIMAAAIENRLAVNEWLGIDASLLYGLGRTSGGVTSAELADASNLYNLSVRGHKGLPPTPIAAPGRASIEAVVNPADDPDVFFWCAVNLETGETKFADTQAEHDKNVAELHEWMNANPGWNG